MFVPGHCVTFEGDTLTAGDVFIVIVEELLVTLPHIVDTTQVYGIPV